MPYLSVETSLELDAAGRTAFLSSASQKISEMLGKPQNWVMVSIRDGLPMIFAGDQRPTAFVRLKSISFPAARCAELSAALCQFLAEQLDLPADRIYIDFADLNRSMFGWNAGTF